MENLIQEEGLTTKDFWRTYFMKRGKTTEMIKMLSNFNSHEEWGKLLEKESQVSHVHYFVLILILAFIEQIEARQ